MIIDEDILKDGIDEVLLAKLIGKHSLEQERYEKLYNYYIGKHAICERRRSSDNIANNKIVCNHAKYIVDIAKSYLVGNPVAYSCSDGYDIEAVKNCFAVQDMPSLDAEFEKTMSIFGKAYELVYADEQSQPKSVCLPPSNTFIVYGAGVGEIPLYGIHYYKKRDIDGSVTGVCCIVCDREMIYTYENTADSFLHMTMTNSQHHYFGKILGGLAVKAGQTVGGNVIEEGKEAGSGAGVDYEVLETYKGKDLEYKEYEPLYQCAADVAAKQHKKGHFVTCDDYVTMSDGTGIVHIAPAFGEDDAKVGRKYDLPFVQFVDGKGELTKETPYAGLFVKKADPEVLKDLDKEGKLFDAPKFEHDYPFCWRCDTPLIYYARESWFIKMSDPEVKANLIANNKTINWIPETIGTGRFGAWLENVQDWGISRNRYWGTPLNIWVCDDCGEMLSIGSKAELKEHSDNCPDDIELHRPYIDAVTCTCPKCKGKMKRVPEVID